jgi:hypothetical protein
MGHFAEIEDIGQKLGNIGQTLGRYWAEIGQKLGRHWVDIVQTLGRYWAAIEVLHISYFLYFSCKIRIFSSLM